MASGVVAPLSFVNDCVVVVVVGEVLAGGCVVWKMPSFLP